MILRVLGIETSCDETAAAIVAAPADASAAPGGDILGHQVLSQIDEHALYRGVVPEIAARSHLVHLDRLIRVTLDEAGLGFDDLDAVAATAGPGLIGGVMVGVTMAKAIALARNLPFVAVNHLEGHALTARLTGDTRFPFLLLLVSGGHCQLLAVAGVGDYRLLGSTRDDAVGEAFDKTAKLMGFGYPGGPVIEQLAAEGDPAVHALPRPMLGKPGCDFSFAGLKTAVRQELESWPAGAQARQTLADLAASFQAAAGDVLVDRSRRAMLAFRDIFGGADHDFVVAGGVAANQYLRGRLEQLAGEQAFRFAAPPLALCTDNAAMIAWAGLEHFRLGHTDGLDFRPRPRWPLQEMADS